jgi:hypothetical protein
MVEEPVCKRCGNCCHYVKDGRVKSCSQLVKIGKKTACRIYRNRLGYKVDEGVHCANRKDVPFDFPGCPYNTGKPMMEVKNGIDSPGNSG